MKFQVALFLITAYLRATLIGAQKNNSVKLEMLFGVTSIQVADPTGDLCPYVQQTLVDIVNGREDILPGYELVFNYQDEGPNSFYAPQRIVDFSRKMDNNDSSYLSPITFAGGYTTGCKAIAPMFHHLNLVDIAGVCLSPFFTANRAQYPNFYRARISGEAGAFARLIFIRNIGKWRKIAILANTAGGSVVNIYTASYFYAFALANGFEVVRYDAVIEATDEMIIGLKQSGARIVSYETTDVKLASIFLCQAFRFGMTGRRYVFILPASNFVDPYNQPEYLAPNCPRTVVIEQLRQTFFIGSAWSSIGFDFNGTTTLGYNQQQFDEMLERKVTNARGMSGWPKRNICHDQILQAILSLDGTEKILRQRNMTLKDFARYPKEVMEAANQSAASVNFVGLRQGLIKLSKRLEQDSEPQYVLQWTPNDKPARVCYEIKLPFDDPNYSDLGSYQVRALNAIQWLGEDNKPPRDSCLERFITLNIPQEFIAVISAISILATLLQFWSQRNFIVKTEIRQSVRGTKLILFTLGCVLMNAAAVSFSIDSIQNFLCPLEVAFGSIGIALVNGSFASHALLAKLMYRTQPGTKNTNRPGIKALAKAKVDIIFMSQRASQIIRQKKRQQEEAKEATHAYSVTFQKAVVFLGTCGLALLNLVIVAIWFLVDPIKGRHLELPSQSGYDEATDTLSHVFVDICPLKGGWLFTLAVIDLMPAVVAAILITTLRSVDDADIRRLRWASLQSVPIFIAVGYILLLTGGSPILQQMVVSIGYLTVSIGTGFFMLTEKIH